MKPMRELSKQRMLECKTIVAGELKKQWKPQLAATIRPIQEMDYFAKLHLMLFKDYKRMWDENDERRNELKKRIVMLR